MAGENGSSSASTSRFEKRDFDNNILSTARNLANRPARPLYKGPRIAERDQTAALAEAKARENFGPVHQGIFRTATDRLQNIPSTYNAIKPQLDRALSSSALTQTAPYFANAQKGILPAVENKLHGYNNPISQADINRYLTPYDATMKDMQAKELRRWEESTLPELQRSSIGQGAFGGGKYLEALQRGSRDAQENLGREFAANREKAYSQAYGMAQADRDRQLGAANAVGQFGGQDINQQVQAGQAAGQIAGADTERQLNASNIAATAAGRDNLMTGETARSMGQLNNEYMEANRENSRLGREFGMQNEQRIQRGLDLHHEDSVRQWNEPAENAKQAAEISNAVPRSSLTETTSASSPPPEESPWKMAGGLFQTVAGMASSPSPSSAPAPYAPPTGYAAPQAYVPPPTQNAFQPLGAPPLQPGQAQPNPATPTKPAAHGGPIRHMKFARGGQVQYFADGGAPTGTNHPMEMLPQYRIPENPDELMYQQQARDHQQMLRNPNPNQAFSEGLIKSGLGMLASKNPSTVGAFGEGAREGFDHYLGKKKEEASDMEKALNIQKLLGDTKRIQAREEHDRMMKEEKRKIDQGYLGETKRSNQAKENEYERRGNLDERKLSQDMEIEKMRMSAKAEGTSEKLNPFQTAKLKEDAKYLAKLREEEKTTDEKLNLMKEVADLINVSGPTGKVSGDYLGWMNDLNPAYSDNRQTLGKALNNLVGLRAKEMTGGNAVEKNKQARAELPGLDKNPETNRRIIVRKMAELERQKQKIQFLDNYAAEGVPLHVALKAFDQWNESNPLVDKKHNALKPKGSPDNFLKQMMKEGVSEEPVVEEEIVVAEPAEDARKQAALKILEMRRAKNKKAA